MKQFFSIFAFVLIFSCAPKKVVELPQVKQVDISKLSDLSAAYLFFEPSQKDSIELNRKNLISTTNWVLNVDKRLSLNKVIPKVIFLQDKKRQATHKNPDAKNYFTCDDLSQNTLGFIDFTQINYHLNEIKDDMASKNKTLSWVSIEHSDRFHLNLAYNDSIFNLKGNISKLKTTLDSIHNEHPNQKFALRFKGELTFQDYITVKSKLTKWSAKAVTLSPNEFIFN